MKHYMKLPEFSYPVTTMKFSPAEPVLTLACSNSFIYQYNVERGDLTTWAKRHTNSLPPQYLKEKGVISSISFNPANPSVCFLSSPTFLCKVDFSKYVDRKYRAAAENAGKKRLYMDADMVPVPTIQKLPPNFAMIYNYAPVLYNAFLAPDELVVVQRPRAEYIKQLPAPV